MLEMIKDMLFNIIGITGLVFILVALAYGSGCLISKVQKSYKIIIQANQVKKNSNYTDKDYICIDKNGKTLYSGLEPEKEIEACLKVIQRSEGFIKMRNQLYNYSD